MSQSIQIVRFRGDTYRLRITFTNADTGEPIDVTGAVLLLTVNSVAAPVDATDQLLQITGVNFGAGTDGVVDFTPTTDDADNVGDFFYDVQMTGSGGEIRTLLKGQFVMMQDITKPAP